MTESIPLTGGVNKRKVTFLTFAGLVTGAGVETFLLNVIRYAPKQRFDIRVIQTDFVDRARLTAEHVERATKGTEVITIKSFRRYLKRFANNHNIVIFALLQIPTFLLYEVYRSSNEKLLRAAKDSDLIYVTSNDDISLVYSNPKAVVIGSTHVSSLSPFQPGRFGWLSRLILQAYLLVRYRHIRGFHYLSSKLAHQSVLHKSRDFTLCLGTDTTAFFPTPRATKTDQVNFLFVGRLEKEKGIETLLRAWRMISGGNVQLHIAGLGSREESVRSAAAVDPTIHYHGVLSTDEIAALYRSCDAFVFPSEFETYGLVVLDALASGLFVIASEKVRGNFDDFERISMVEYVPNHPSLIMKSMQRVVANIDVIRARSSAVHEYVKSEYSWGVVSARLFEKFEEVTGPST